MRPVAPICGRAVLAAAGRLPPAGDASRRDGELAVDRRDAGAASGMDRASPRQHRPGASERAGRARRQGAGARAPQ